MLRFFLASAPIFAVVALGFAAATPPVVGPDCTARGFKLHGRIQVVNAFPDLKVQVVDAFPDTKVQFVTAFPDVKIKFIESFPGLP